MQPEMDVVATLIRSAGRRVEPPQEAYRQVFVAAHTAFRAKAARQRNRALMLWAGAAAAIVLGVVLAMRWTSPLAPPAELAQVARVAGAAEFAAGDGWRPLPGAGARLAAGTRIRTRSDGRAAIVLAAGESLRMAPDTEVVLDAPGRLYLQRGTAYLDGGTRPARAGIEVVTPAGTARELGTQFELHVAGTGLRLRVREGSVAIDHGGHSVTGLAGEEVSIDAFGGVLRTTIRPDDPAWQWAEAIAPMPDMDGQPAATLIAWVARETGRRLRYESPLVEQRAGSVILHGEIRHLAPMEALEAMLATTDLQVALDGNTMEVRSRSHDPPGL
jgi:ferric-dicitrate binding protein FerR (iron transport regulator)